jgi:molybdate transport system substrate-binding protein
MRLLLAGLLAMSCSLALGDEVRVLSGGAARGFVEPLAKSFSPHSVQLEWQPMGKLVQSLAAGHAADMVIVTSEVLGQLEREGRIAPGSARPLARVGIGVAVNEKAPNPDISTPEALKRTLLAARSVVYIDPKTGTSGKHVEEMFAKLGILEAMRAKATLGQGGYVTEPVGRGEIELGIHQVSEILPVKGVRLVGPLPPELQKYTVYVGAPLLQARNKAAVDAFIAYLTGPKARERLAAAGYTAPE